MRNKRQAFVSQFVRAGLMSFTSLAAIGIATAPATVAAQQAAPASQVVDIAIPEQSMADALKAFARQVDKKIVFRVVVVEGKVLVDSRTGGRMRRQASTQSADPAPAASDRALLVAGQQAQLGASSGLPVIETADIVAATSWRMRQLSFDGAALDEIVAEFNRYNRTAIVVADPSLGGTRLSGVFDANDPNSFVAFLELSATVAVDRSDRGQIVLRSKEHHKDAGQLPR